MEKFLHVAMLAIAVATLILRKWTFRALNVYFTFRLEIQQGHKLIKDGPYKILQHPSYTAVLVNDIAVQAFLLHEGLWDVMHALLTERYGSSTLGVQMNTTRLEWLGLSSSLWAVFFYAVLTVRIVMKRIYLEESMLQRHFGKEWHEYASKRWRLVPFVF